MDKARRDNGNKIRMELIPSELDKELGKVFTIGAEKYTIKDDQGNIISPGDNNWRKGMSWMSVIASTKRHINKFISGEDFDHDYPKELLEKHGPTYHIANAIWGLTVLLNYYKSHPELDDRPHTYLTTTKIGLDVDQVICDFNGPWSKLWGHDLPECWFFDGNIKEKFDKMKEESKLDEFYSNLPPIVSPKEIPFEPHCYITSRPVDSSVTIAWLLKNKFPMRPVYTVEPGVSKATVIKEAGCDVFVDDRWDNFVELTKEGVCCYLLDAPWNHRYNCGYKRIKSLKELI